MHETIRFGRIAGISVGINWSVVVIAALVTWGLASQTLPELSPGHPTAAYWAVAAGASVLFFTSLLAHEMGHSLVARRHGVEVEAITLWMLGGVAKLRGGASSAADELKITAVGPAVSVAIAVVSGALALGLGAVGTPELLVTGLAWLAGINLLLAVFNLVPAFPLDGGRILRAVLWSAWSDQLRATRAAAAVGRTFGYGFVALGLLAAAGGAGVSGVWLAFIGLFLTFASTAEAAQTEQETLLRGLLVRDVMTPDPVTAPAGITVDELIDRYVLRAHVSAFPVVDDDRRLQGLVTLDRVRSLDASRRSTATVGLVASPLAQVAVASPDEPANALISRLALSPDRRALVVDRGRLVGIVSSTDITRALEVRSLTHRPTGGAPAPAAVAGPGSTNRPHERITNQGRTSCPTTPSIS
jgi:Zn-dependent protease